MPRPRIRRWFSWKVWDAQSAAVVLERQEAAQQRWQQEANRTAAQAAAFHRWQLDCVPHFLRQADEVVGITAETPHAEAWAEYLRWCKHHDFQPLAEREFAQERSLYR
jgi:hypothetical protein